MQSRRPKLCASMWLTALLAVTGFLLAWATEARQLDDPSKKTRREKILDDRDRIAAEGFWIYNDLPGTFAKAKETGKPLLVVLRCLPCEECVKLDDELVDQDPTIRPLLSRFVCARVVATNGLDLTTFQYDTDQSFAAFMLNADGAIYGRFGTRSHRTEWLGDVSLSGLAQALSGALALHAEYPANREALAGKRGPAPLFASPEQFPSLREQFGPRLDYENQVEKSCIHCHQIGDAQREFYRERGEPIPETVLFPFPHPKSLGLIFDADQRATVKSVEANSLGEQSGFLAGDVWQRMDGQPLLSIADVQWVLHQTPATGGTVTVDLLRLGEPKSVALTLPSGWRRSGDLAWRASSWTLRRMTTGGLVLAEATPAERQQAEIADGKMALRVQYVGEYDEHAAAKRAGFQLDDLLIEVDGRDDLRRESDLFAFGVRERAPGDQLDVVVKRGKQRLNLRLPMQP